MNTSGNVIHFILVVTEMEYLKKIERSNDFVCMILSGLHLVIEIQLHVFLFKIIEIICENALLEWISGLQIKIAITKLLNHLFEKIISAK